jgi:hypothetical protein
MVRIAVVNFRKKEGYHSEVICCGHHTLTGYISPEKQSLIAFVQMYGPRFGNIVHIHIYNMTGKELQLAASIAMRGTITFLSNSWKKLEPFGIHSIPSPIVWLL